MINDKTCSVLQPGEKIKPSVTLEDVPQLVKKYYGGLKIKVIKECNGYDDRNYYLETDNEDGESGKYIFKVLNSKDSKDPGHVQAEHSVMRFLAKKGLKCPTPRKSSQGNDYEVIDWKIDIGSSQRYIIRLLNFVEGTVIHDVIPTPSLLTNVGEYISLFNLHLKDHNEPSLENHTSIWMINRVPDLKDFMYVIKEEKEKYETVCSVLKAFEERVLPAYTGLERGILHGDFNEHNVLVNQADSSSEYEVSGLIDFGDMHISCYVFELAITMCYMMLECLKSEDVDPFVGAAYVLAGYAKHRRVSDVEVDLLRTLIASRLCQSLVLGAYSYSLDPGNEYLLTTAKTGWDLLFRVWRMGDEEFKGILKSVGIYMAL